MFSRLVPIIILTPVLFLLATFYSYQKSVMQKLLYMSFACYLSLLISVTFFPFPYAHAYLESVRAHPQLQAANNFIPFYIIFYFFMQGVSHHLWNIFFENVGGNILLLLPFGIYLPLFIYKHIAPYKVVIYVFLISFSIECTQGILNSILGVHYRTVDIDDIILNTFGGMIGVYCYRKFIYPFIK